MIMKMTRRAATSGLFDSLPEFPPALPEDELQLLAALPEWPTIVQLDYEEHAAARRLSKRGLVKIQRFKFDPVATYAEWYAGKLPTAALREAK